MKIENGEDLNILKIQNTLNISNLNTITITDNLHNKFQNTQIEDYNTQ